MQILVDADACPSVVKDILFRAGPRVKVCVTLVANQFLRTPPSPYIRAIQVPSGFDVADSRIVEMTRPGDLIVTADIPLAAAVLAKGAHALDPRGEWFSAENIEERLTIRSMMDQLRSTGVATGGPSPYSPRDNKNFAAQLDRFLARRRDAGTPPA
ncbi:YaiI/YqxD family protein [Caballeronia ptereochthonis]|jgi:uncharacterized protein YaiI (UPF0178 family)|uniref:UPF0178 protein AWB83_03099 n=1 Tax=Caballeronia ptereochthonis TaxID=1777144 RepID=A0A158BCK9_9BURK|nr:YaiI/YqxD family protein [Caballeronia ptereochthonis]SAK67526.1 hypothetical protein AWB83_03099 [Caballeronia ptereochthonis]